MPTIFHKEIVAKTKEVINEEDGSDGFFNLSDESPTYSYYAKFELSENGDIVIHSKVQVSDDEKEEFRTVLSLLPDQRKNGFVQYRFDESIIPENYRMPFKRNLTNAMYHKIKELYHEHECNTGKDSDLCPKIQDEPFELDQNDNEALMGFLEDFSRLFCANAKSVSELNKRAKELFVEFRWVQERVWELSKSDSLHWEDLREFYDLQHSTIIVINTVSRLCENSSIEYTYCKTLLSSIYNKSFKHDNTPNPAAADFEIQNNRRRSALNIRNAVRYIENIKYKNLNRQNELLQFLTEDVQKITANTQKITTKVDETLQSDKKWQMIGISLAIYSVLCTLLSILPDIFKIEMYETGLKIAIGVFTILLIPFLLLPKHLIALWRRFF